MTRRRASRPRRIFLIDVLAGLRTVSKQLPCKYLYDFCGSQLFDRICQLDEYYLTRSELAIMDRFAPKMGLQIGSGAMLVEYGSGSSVKHTISWMLCQMRRRTLESTFQGSLCNKLR